MKMKIQVECLICKKKLTLYEGDGKDLPEIDSLIELIKKKGWVWAHIEFEIPDKLVTEWSEPEISGAICPDCYEKLISWGDDIEVDVEDD